MPAAPIAGQGVFSAPIMTGRTCVASPVPRLVCMKVVELLCPALRDRAVIPVVRIVAVVHVAVKAARTVKPGAGPDEDPSYPPVGPVVAVGSAVVRSIVKISVGADRRHSNIDADVNLSRRRRRNSRRRKATERNCESRQSKNFDLGHKISL